MMKVYYIREVFTVFQMWSGLSEVELSGILSISLEMLGFVIDVTLSRS